MFSVLEAYVVDDDADCVGLVKGVLWSLSMDGLRSDKLVDLSRDKASHRACLAMWTSVWSLLSH